MWNIKQILSRYVEYKLNILMTCTIQNKYYDLWNIKTNILKSCGTQKYSNNLWNIK